MRTFVVIEDGTRTAQLQAALDGRYPNAVRKVREGVWLVKASDVTTKDISDRLGISDGETSSGIVIGVDYYFGRWSADLWEWMKVASEQV